MREFTLLFLFFICGCLFAQDIHFSQFNASPGDLNPSLTGLFNGDYRFIGNHKNQWMSVPVPYKTYSLSADMKLPFKIVKDFSVGIIFNKDKAGDTDFRTNQAALSIAYRTKLNQQATQLLSLGLQTGISGKNFNSSDLTFDNQYNGDIYDPGIASVENFSSTKVNYFDASAGINWLYKIGQRTSLNIGSSVFHLNQPSESFWGDKIIKLDQKFSQHATYQTKINAGMDLISSVLFSTQGKYSEFLAGSSLKYFLQSDISLGTAIYLGAFYRLKDAVIITSGMDYNNFTLGLSYDINFSGLTPASNHRGGFELSLIYIIQKFTPLRSNKISCPAFI